jgi:hypothetical protein
MNATGYISIALGLLKIVLEHANVQGIAADVVGEIQAAVDKLETVKGTPVTWQQLDSLRVTPKW